MRNVIDMPETEVIASIERLELELRDLYRRVERAITPADKRVLNQQISEVQARVQNLRDRLKR